MAINRSLQHWPEDLIYALDESPEAAPVQEVLKQDKANEENLNHKIAA